MGTPTAPPAGRGGQRPRGIGRRAGAAAAELDDAGPRQEVEPLGDLGERHRRVAAGQQVADVADRALAVDQVERLVGEHLVALLERDRGPRLAEHRREVVVVVDVERAAHGGRALGHPRIPAAAGVRLRRG
ncbi:MAG TPA: hypothetical protein VF516_32535, partial [Kofleriaceae bacterium]